MKTLATSALGLLIGVIYIGLNTWIYPALAQETTNSGTIQFEPTELNDSSSLDLSDILKAEGQEQTYLEDKNHSPVVAFVLDVINFITRIIGVITMVLIIIGGLLLIVSNGDDNQIQKGKGILQAAIIGLVIVMFSYVIVRFFQSLFYLQ